MKNQLLVNSMRLRFARGKESGPYEITSRAYRIWVSITPTTLSRLHDHHNTLSLTYANSYNHKDALADFSLEYSGSVTVAVIWGVAREPASDQSGYQVSILHANQPIASQRYLHCVAID